MSRDRIGIADAYGVPRAWIGIGYELQLEGRSCRVADVNEADGTVTLAVPGELPIVVYMRQLIYLAADPATRRREHIYVARHSEAWFNSTEAEKKEARQRQNHVREVLTGYEAGHAGGAIGDEPLSLFDLSKSVTSRQAAKAQLLKKSRITILNWCQRFMRLGIVGLLDGRAGGPKNPLATLDPLWRIEAQKQLDARAGQPELDLLGLAQNIEIEVSITEPRAAIPRPQGAINALKWMAGKGGQLKRNRAASRKQDLSPSGATRGYRAVHANDVVQLDSTRFDVRVRDSETDEPLRVELTWALNQGSRTFHSISLVPTTRATDVGAVLYETLFPPDNLHDFPYNGVPQSLLVHEDVFGGFIDPNDPVQRRRRAKPIAPSTIVVDNGKVYIAEYIYSLCQRLGINVEPTAVHAPTGKPHVESGFGKLNVFAQFFSSYTGRSVSGRGVDVDRSELPTVKEIETELRLYLRDVYHRSIHSGLHLPQDDTVKLTPIEALVISQRAWGAVQYPLSPDLAFEFLPVFKRIIDADGIHIKTFIYDSELLNEFRDMPSGDRTSIWDFSFRRDPHNVNQIYFRHPTTERWIEIPWVGRDLLGTEPLLDEELRLAKAFLPDHEVETQRDLYSLLRDFRVRRGIGDFTGAVATRADVRRQAARHGYALFLETHDDIIRESLGDLPDTVPVAWTRIDGAEDLDTDEPQGTDLDIDDDDDDLFARSSGRMQ